MATDVHILIPSSRTGSADQTDSLIRADEVRKDRTRKVYCGETDIPTDRSEPDAKVATRRAAAHGARVCPTCIDAERAEYAHPADSSPE